MRAYATPVLIGKNQAIRLERVSIKAGADGDQFSEEWLQKVLFNNPACLPISSIDASMEMVVPICCELGTPAGPADILLVTPTGKIVLVETKLYRNPEARRAVVAQIIDYAKELTSWTYEDLAREVARATGKGPNHLLEAVLATFHDLDEARFIDGINRSLRNAEMLLLVVGDGITTGTEALLGFLERYGTLQFSFGLIEATVYKMPDGQFLVSPRILAPTEILTRTLLIGQDGRVVPETEPEGERTLDAGSNAEWFKTFWTEYLTRLQLDDMKQPQPKPARSTNMFFPMPPGGQYCWVSAYLAKSADTGGVYLAFGSRYSASNDVMARLKEEQLEIECEVGTSLNWKTSEISADVPFGDLDDPTERNRVIDILADLTNRFVNAFRPRLEKILHSQETR